MHSLLRLPLALGLLLLSGLLALPAFAQGTGYTIPAATPSITEPPEAALSPDSLVFVLDADEQVVEQPLTLANVADEGAAGLTFTAFTRKAEGETLLSTGDETILTQSLSQDIISGFASVCNLEATTSYWRVFDLAETDLTGEFAVVRVEIGIAMSPSLTTTLRLYRLDGSLQFGTLTLLDEVEVPLDSIGAPVLLPVDVAATIDTGAQLAVEWNTPFVPDEGPFFGANPSGETHPRYQSYPGCFATDFPPIAQPSPDTHWVLNVVGTAGPPPFTVAPGDGIISAGENAELTVAVDATTLEDGIHPYEVIVLTNDPNAPSLIVPVTVEVEGGRAVSMEESVPEAFALAAPYPNPFADATTIPFTLAEPTTVRLDVFDAMGRRVAVLRDGAHSAGRYEVTWGPDGLAAGTYFVRLQAGDEMQTLRAVIVR